MQINGIVNCGFQQVADHVCSHDRDLEAAEQWPAQWQRLSGIKATDLAPHGVTHTIAAILDTAETEPVGGTI